MPKAYTRWYDLLYVATDNVLLLNIVNRPNIEYLTYLTQNLFNNIVDKKGCQ
jgi:hypothetical protein